jgi:hypothetical protein
LQLGKKARFIVDKAKKRVREVTKIKTGIAVDQLDSVGAEGTTTQKIQLESFYSSLKNDNYQLNSFPKQSEQIVRVISKCIMSFLKTFLSF